MSMRLSGLWSVSGELARPDWFSQMRTRKHQDPELVAAREAAFQARMAAARRDSVALRQRVLDEMLADIDRKQKARQAD